MIASRRACQLRAASGAAGRVRLRHRRRRYAGCRSHRLDWSVQDLRQADGERTHAMQADMNWFAVLAHHATRTPDKAITVFEGETTTYGEMADAGRRAGRRPARARRRPRRRRRRCSRTTAPSSWRRSSPPTTSAPIAMPINWRLAAPEVRYILEHSEARALVCDEALVDLADEATKGMEATLAAGLRRRRRRPTDGRRSPTCAPTDAAADARRRGGRRRPPADVHVGHHRAAQGRDAHPRQPGVEEPRPHRRVRLHRAPTSGSPAGRCTTSARSTSRPPR